ncbi:hypothetical protein [Nocardioides speluncae]|uniref:hypothetical protein n=1 Tax=Nocardioides speluncae TaxID=2670337 RepID=UPI000D69F351|nr:hypothetical protein [Nocardioides speluncae]
MLDLHVSLHDAIFRDLRAALAATSDDRDAAERIAAVVADHPEFGAEGQFLSRHPGDYFALAGLRSSEVWADQVAKMDYLTERLTESSSLLSPYLPTVTKPREISIAVHPVPGLTTSYRTPDGGQLLGLYAGADRREMLLYLSYTYYRELTHALQTPASVQAETDPSSPERFRTALMLQIRNEGLAHYVILRQLRALRAEGIEFHYFPYARLIDDADTVSRALATCGRLLAGLDGSNLRATSAEAARLLKDPQLPLVGVIGVHAAEAVVASHGERALFDLEHREPDDFFSRYAGSDDPLRYELFGTGPHAGIA